jgi:hypothetical protein
MMVNVTSDAIVIINVGKFIDSMHRIEALQVFVFALSMAC